jgi:predicted ATPase/transcriptional regulator with XRE-family HTH domain
MAYTSSFGKWLKQRRQQLDLTQRELAAKVGCAVVTLRKLEADEIRPSKQLVEKLAEELELPPAEQRAFLNAARGYNEYKAKATAANFPASETSVPATPSSNTNLLLPLNPLIGREKEVAAVAARLISREIQLVTLSGPPGIGKTRLSMQVAAELLPQFSDGVFFVALAPLAEARLVVATIAETLGLKESAGHDLFKTLKAYLQTRKMLLVLDNFEQVLGAAPLVAELLSGAPQLKVLVTSREILHLYAEHDYPLSPLALPDLQNLPPLPELEQYSTVQLFVQRARAVNPDFTLNAANARAVVEICTRLDGLPLAIELAAARSKLFGPRALLSRLDNRLNLLAGYSRDLPPRQRTLRGAIDWSYQLLSEAEKRLFRRLSVFVGGWTLEAATIVCNKPTLLELDVTEGLTSLVDKSLVRLEQGSDDEPRFTMLETILEYSRMELAASGEEEEEKLREAHFAYFLELAEQFWLEWNTAQLNFWLNRLETENANLRAALDWTVNQGHIMEGLELAGALWVFWTIRGYLTEGRERLARLLKLAEGLPASKTVARALNGAGHLARDQADNATARILIERSLAMWQELGNKREMAWALNGLGLLAFDRGDNQAARNYYEQSLALWQEVGERWGYARVNNDLGHLANREGRFEEAVARHKESLAIFQETGDKQAIGWATIGLGHRLQIKVN